VFAVPPPLPPTSEVPGPHETMTIAASNSEENRENGDIDRSRPLCEKRAMT
jgi:hypothetical protein